ncbi:MAG: type II toxin-antitoxin system VapC family toxin [Thermomicrobiales bacterium]
MSAPPLYILDSDTVSFHQRGYPAVVARFASITPESIATTIITVEEQFQGRLARVGRQPDLAGLIQRLRATQAYFCMISILPFDSDAAAQYRDLQARRLRTGTNDLRIAAIALVRRAILVTSNRRDFERIEELRWEDWQNG